MKLTFCGACGIVTGSCYHLLVGGKEFLVDCGMFQGGKDVTRRNYERFLFDPKKISAVFVTHSHIDHIGLLPKLVKAGFHGRIYATSASIDIAKAMLADSGHVQEMENKEENRRRQREGLPSRNPLYTEKEAKAVDMFFSRVQYDRPLQLGSVQVTFVDAGHIVGSAMIEVVGDGKKVVFSGDIGQFGAPIVNAPTVLTAADAVVMESTYGNRLHDPLKDRNRRLKEVILSTYRKGGRLLIPSFALERTQELLFALKELQDTLPDQKIYVDSPLANKVTKIFETHAECFDEDTRKMKAPFSPRNLVAVATVAQSIKLNEMSKPCIIIAGNGTCTGGRIRHHLKHGLWNPKNTLLFVGYQPKGTLGRYIMDGEHVVRMMGMHVSVKTDVQYINSFSAHADQNDLVKWVSSFTSHPKVFICHGEPAASEALKEKLSSFSCHIPAIGDSFTL